jgi:glycerol uptake facilitator-like aquaporin
MSQAVCCGVRLVEVLCGHPALTLVLAVGNKVLNYSLLAFWALQMLGAVSCTVACADCSSIILFTQIRHPTTFAGG